MDPITHLLVGAGIAELSGKELSLTNPVYLAALIGSVTPDLDIVYQLKGHVSYLKNHRGFSHSLPGIILSSAVIAYILELFVGGNIGNLFLWALIGSASHLVMDVLNSYGAQILWPLSKKKLSLNLLVLFDPVIIALFLAAIIWPAPPRQVAMVVLAIAGIYLMIRMYMRYSILFFVKDKYRDRNIQNIVVMPAMVSLWNWTFLVETDEKYIVGEARWFTFKTGVKRVLDKVPNNHFVKAALHSRIGSLFQNFTPYYHIHYYQDGDNHVVCFADLRYFVKDDFLHNATVVLSKEYEVSEAIFQPYSKNHKLTI